MLAVITGQNGYKPKRGQPCWSKQGHVMSDNVVKTGTPKKVTYHNITKGPTTSDIHALAHCVAKLKRNIIMKHKHIHMIYCNCLQNYYQNTI